MIPEGLVPGFRRISNVVYGLGLFSELLRGVKGFPRKRREGFLVKGALMHFMLSSYVYIYIEKIYIWLL